ncbi:M23 family metallopeptidase [Micavibrio aeruginosavorus]|uniref:M23 family metallopeptidase n=1 Tax=Micavibrio aeruginosavorus TaxID=349221 RepID=UPI0005A1BD72|nr:M23 family metallopeptidase [Micavibrio aeruginosavorus]
MAFNRLLIAVLTLSCSFGAPLWAQTSLPAEQEQILEESIPEEKIPGPALVQTPSKAQTPAPTPSGPPQLMMPAACALGTDCWVVNYIDTDTEKDSARDYTCGPRTYDGHDGTDFAIRDRVAMDIGVGVVAAANGRVVRVRDGQDDQQPTGEQIQTMLSSNLGCGNGVLIDHGNGWQSISCHMKKGSITVKPNQPVRAGERIGEIGQSGAAEFPHLHFSLFKGGTIIDPFSGEAIDGGCGGTPKPLWLMGLTLPYEPVALYAGGFTPGEPVLDGLRIDATGAATVRADAPALSFWVGIYGVREGDVIHMTITDPLGRPFASRAITQDKTRARQFYYVGRKVRGTLMPGPYTGTLTLERTGDGVTTETISRALERMVTVTSVEP